MNIKDLEHKFAYKISGKNRRKKFDYFMDVFQPDENTSILDVGPQDKEFSPTDNLIEKLYPYQKNLTALGVEKFNGFKSRYPDVTIEEYDGKIFPFADNSFDICWSNAVIEHVGDFERQLLFLKEIKRVSRNAYLTTPNKFFPIEVHTRTPFLHFLPKSVFHRYLHLVGKAWAAGDYMYLLSYREIVDLLQKAGIDRFEVKRNRMLGFSVDFVIMFGEKLQMDSS